MRVSSPSILLKSLRSFLSARAGSLFSHVQRRTIFDQPNLRDADLSEKNIRMASKVQAGEAVSINGRQYRAIREGLAQILAPYRSVDEASSSQVTGKKSHNNDEGDQAVFYNPIQQYNRDLSVLAILIYGEGVLAEKEGKRNERAKRDRRGRKHSKAAPASEPESPIVNGGGRKRKADVLEEVGQNGSDGKKPRRDQQSADDHDVANSVVPQNQGAVDLDASTTATVNASKVEYKDNTIPAKAHCHDSKPVAFTILDALSASGLRAIRYAKEIAFATNVVANDLSPEAVKSIELNIDHNNLRGRVHSNVGDARAYMYSKVGNEHKSPAAGYVHKFDVVDLDPYGTAAPFLDAALQALADGGMLCVTCTDAAVFASNGYPEKAYSLYNGVTMKGAFSHEAGLRLILHAVATSAAKYSIAIEPLLSLSIDFYARLFIRVHRQQQQVKLLAGTTMITYSCDFGCGAWITQTLARNQEKQDRVGDTIFKHSYAQAPVASPLCGHCGSKMHLGGPMWAGPIHNPYFIQKILDKLPSVDKTTYQTLDRVKGMLTIALEEDLTLATSNTPSQVSKPGVATDVADNKLIPRLPPQIIDAAPFFFIPNFLAKILHCVTPPEDQLRGAIRHLGYRVTRSHCKAGSFKTNAPWDVLWEIMREWVRQHAPIKEGKITKGMPGWRIVQNIRGTATRNVMDIQETIKRALERGIDGKDTLRALLESGLYRLEHQKLESDDDNGSQDNVIAQESELIESSGHPDRLARDGSREVSKLKIIFDAELGKEKPRGRLVRYQLNPRANWGPMNRAGGG